MTHTHAKSQGHISFSSKELKKTDGQMDEGDSITSHTNVIGKYAIISKSNTA